MGMLAINHNFTASAVANTLSEHYGRLQISTQRLSSGLRINSAADDAAGLAIRELQRSDIAALEQGARNVNDAISMIQTFDGALSVIDEKLIRMKELAEQAATGTYNSTQRLMIDSEFQAMGDEIDRIARATDFNGIKLLTSKLTTWYTEEERFVVTDPGSIAHLALSGGNSATPTLAVNAGHYINKDNPTKTISVSLTARAGTRTETGRMTSSTTGTTTTYNLVNSPYSVAFVDNIRGVDPIVVNYAGGAWTMGDANNPSYSTRWRGGGTILNGELEGPPPDYLIVANVDFSLSDRNGTKVNMQNMSVNDPTLSAFNIDTANNTWSITRSVVEITDDTADYRASYNADTKTVTVNLKNGGGTVTMALGNALNAGDTINFDINMEGETRKVQVEHHGVDPSQKVKIHFGPENDSAEDYYYINYANCTREGLGLDNVKIDTQEDAQNALTTIGDAIVVKDKFRAEYGSMQNRLENTMTNITVQAENLQASESRISDAEIATEMMQFVKNQILTQSAVAMLAQANSMPQMVMRLIS